MSCGYLVQRQCWSYEDLCPLTVKQELPESPVDCTWLRSESSTFRAHRVYQDETKGSCETVLQRLRLNPSEQPCASRAGYSTSIQYLNNIQWLTCTNNLGGQTVTDVPLIYSLCREIVEKFLLIRWQLCGGKTTSMKCTEQDFQTDLHLFVLYCIGVFI